MGGQRLTIRFEGQEIYIESEQQDSSRQSRLLFSKDCKTWTEITDFRLRNQTFVVSPDLPALGEGGNFFKIETDPLP